MQVEFLIDFTLSDMQSHWKLLGRGIMSWFRLQKYHFAFCVEKMNWQGREKQKKRHQLGGFLSSICQRSSALDQDGSYGNGLKVEPKGVDDRLNVGIQDTEESRKAPSLRTDQLGSRVIHFTKIGKAGAGEGLGRVKSSVLFQIGHSEMPTEYSTEEYQVDRYKRVKLEKRLGLDIIL